MRSETPALSGGFLFPGLAGQRPGQFPDLPRLPPGRLAALLDTFRRAVEIHQADMAQLRRNVDIRWFAGHA